MTRAPSPLVVIDVVGLSPALLGANTPALNRLIGDGFLAPLDGVFPAVTCTAQASMLTGKLPREHGIVANGWYFRDLAEVWLWRQSNHLVQAEQIWDRLKREQPDFRCAQMFWWYNMYGGSDWSVTPRPIYPADGRKLPGLYSKPAELHRELEDALGPFPLFNFWGPAAGLRSSRWIADSARAVFDRFRPSLQFVYLPHLDYDLQRLGPSDPGIARAVSEIDAVVGELVDHLRGQGAEIMIVSEYGIEDATGHVHINQILRQAGHIAVRETLGWELLDAGASRAFAVADHQVAHVYVQDERDIASVARLLSACDGIERVLDADGKREWGLDHPRAGELVAIAAPGHWFIYYYWLDDARAPDFARTVDIHRKPGYDPVELFIDPELRFAKGRIAMRLLQKKLGMRMNMDVIGLRPELVKGTHGRLAASPDHGPLMIGTDRRIAADRHAMCAVADLIAQHWA